MTDEHDLGLPHDLGRLVSRRRALKVLASAGMTGMVAACDEIPFLSRPEAEATAIGPDGVECVVHPAEIAGPFPADGSNRAHGTLANVLRDSGIVRRDMRRNLQAAGAQADGVAADGVELRLTVTLVGVGTSCVPLSGHAIYLWHCDAAGKYSIYDLPHASYLRAVGVSDAQGKAEFVTIIPGCYQGRFPHMHFEIYPSLAVATDYKNRILTSQLAIPADVCRAVYENTPAYRLSVDNFAKAPLDRDMIFANNTTKQLAAQTLALHIEDEARYGGTVVIGLKERAV
jgi:protocatechuate 3,4-dioxygenase beta subunit